MWRCRQVNPVCFDVPTFIQTFVETARALAIEMYPVVVFDVVVIVVGGGGSGGGGGPVAALAILGWSMTQSLVFPDQLFLSVSAPSSLQCGLLGGL